MDNQKIQEHVQTVREAVGKVTPGIWWHYQTNNSVVSDHKDFNCGRKTIANCHTFDDAKFIANSPTWHQQSIEIIEQQQREIERLRAALTLICHYPPHITTPNAAKYYEEMRSTANFALLTEEDRTPPTECMSCDGSGWVYDYERTGVPEQSACPECNGEEDTHG